MAHVHIQEKGDKDRHGGVDSSLAPGQGRVLGSAGWPWHLMWPLQLKPHHLSLCTTVADGT